MEHQNCFVLCEVEVVCMSQIVKFNIRRGLRLASKIDVNALHACTEQSYSNR